MARLQIKTAGMESQALELRPGINRVGRSPDSDFVINHTTVSTNHSFINGDPIKEARLLPGQMVTLGDVELFVESTEANVVIPEYERARPKPPVVLPDGAMICPRHSRTQAKYKCTHCFEIMCGECVHILRRKGGTPLFLCTLCSHKCEPIQNA